MGGPSPVPSLSVLPGVVQAFGPGEGTTHANGLGRSLGQEAQGLAVVSPLRTGTQRLLVHLEVESNLGLAVHTQSQGQWPYLPHVPILDRSVVGGPSMSVVQHG